MNSHPNANGTNRCECCGRKLTLENVVWLELDHRIDEYHDHDFGVPEDRSQGFFPFGRGCARRAVAMAVEAARARGIYLGRPATRTARAARAAALRDIVQG